VTIAGKRIIAMPLVLDMFTKYPKKHKALRPAIRKNLVRLASLRWKDGRTNLMVSWVTPQSPRPPKNTNSGSTIIWSGGEPVTMFTKDIGLMSKAKTHKMNTLAKPRVNSINIPIFTRVFIGN